MDSMPRTFVPDFVPDSFLDARPAFVTSPPQSGRRAIYREREVGVGYGNSSGYASQRRYARGWAGQPRFRCG